MVHKRIQESNSLSVIHAQKKSMPYRCMTQISERVTLFMFVAFCLKPGDCNSASEDCRAGPKISSITEHSEKYHATQRNAILTQ